MGEIVKRADFHVSASSLGNCPTDGRTEIALIGRSNVGKSSLINMYTGRKSLAKTSQTPGKTRLINYFLVNEKWYLVDLPGYGWAKMSKEEKAKWGGILEEYIAKSPKLKCLLILIDIRREPQKIDMNFMEWVAENEIPFAIVFTKSDKLSKNQIQQSVARYRKVFKVNWEFFPTHIITSSFSKSGKEDMEALITQILEE